MEREGQVTRRDFIRGAAAIGASAAAAGLLGATPSEAAGVPAKWDAEADVVIVGYGDAGASAAIAAADAKANVLILEKMPKDKGAGGNSRVGGNMFLTFTDVQGALTYFNSLSDAWGGPVEEETLKIWAQEMVSYPDWLKSLGAELAPAGNYEPEFPGLAGAKSVRTLRFKKSSETPAGQNRYSPYDFLSGVVAQRSNVKVMYETPGKELITNPAGDVIGVVAEQQGKLINIKAKRAVILSAGGFEFNEEMKRNYIKGQCFGMGSPANTGDAIKMAQKVGADLWHMNNHAGPNPLGFMPPKSQITLRLGMPGNSYIWVGRDGKRFENEARIAAHGKGHDAVYYFDATEERGWFPRVPLWVIFDEKVRTKGMIYNVSYKGFTWNSYHDLYTWSKDNSKEIENGWILKGSTIEELAEKIKVAPSVLKTEVAKYNAACKAKKDEEFGRPEKTLEAIEAAPYYAIEAWPVMVNTQGGPKRNGKAQIVDPFNKPIARLYGAGEMGSIYVWNYNGGGNVGECFAMGRVAGKNAAAEKPWDAAT